MWIEGMSGKIDGKNQAGPLFRTMSASGLVYVSRSNKPRTKPYTESELARQERFAQAAAATKEVMTTPERLKAYKKTFAKQKKYSTLRGFVFAQEMAKLNA